MENKEYFVNDIKIVQIDENTFEYQLYNEKFDRYERNFTFGIFGNTFEYQLYNEKFDRYERNFAFGIFGNLSRAFVNKDVEISEIAKENIKKFRQSLKQETK